MKSSIAFGVLAVVASVAAHEHQHDKFHHQQRAVDTGACKLEYVTITSYGEWALVPETSSAAPSSTSKSSTSTSTSSSTSSTTSTSSSTPPPPPPSTTSTTSTTAPPPPPTTYAAPEPTTSSPVVEYKQATTEAAAPAPSPSAPAAAPAPAPSAPSTSSSGSSGSIAPNGNQWAFCYTPYTSSGGCKSSDEVASDIAGLKSKGFTTIRTYANDCSGLVNIGAACRASGMKMLVGINIDASGISGAEGQVSALKSWGASNWDMVEMVVVGNEAIFQGFTSAGALAGFISQVKGELQSAGYSGPVTTTEPLGTMQEYGSTLCPAIDVVGANIHPFFNTAVSSVLAGPFVATQYALLGAVCGGSKPAYILETGWPSAGSANGIAIPGFDAQKTAITGIMSLVGSKAAVFSYENDNWKAPGPFGVEQHWGCVDLFKQ